MPSDPVALSFWLCKNILPNEEDRLSIFMSNSVTDRMQIIGKSLNVVSTDKNIKLELFCSNYDFIFFF